MIIDAAMQPQMISGVISVIVLSAAKVWRLAFLGKERFTLVSITIIVLVYDFFPADRF